MTPEVLKDIEKQLQAHLNTVYQDMLGQLEARCVCSCCLLANLKAGWHSSGKGCSRPPVWEYPVDSKKEVWVSSWFSVQHSCLTVFVLLPSAC